MNVHDKLTAVGNKPPIPEPTKVSLPQSLPLTNNYSVKYNIPSPVSDDEESKHYSDDLMPPPILNRNGSYPALNSISATRNRDTITSCCFTIDKKLTIFFCQLTVGVSLMMFCCYMLTIKDQCDQQQPFLSLLTFIVGVFLPKESIVKLTH